MTSTSNSDLKVPSGTFKWRLSRARDRLRSALKKLADDPNAVATTMDDLDNWARRVHEQTGDD